MTDLTKLSHSPAPSSPNACPFCLWEDGLYECIFCTYDIRLRAEVTTYLRDLLSGVSGYRTAAHILLHEQLV